MTKTIRDIDSIGHTRQSQDKDNPETLTVLGIQETGQRQSRDTDSIGHTRHRTKTIQRH